MLKPVLKGEFVEAMLDVVDPYHCFRCGSEILPLQRYWFDKYGIIYCIPCHTLMWLGDREVRAKRYGQVH